MNHLSRTPLRTARCLEPSFSGSLVYQLGKLYFRPWNRHRCLISSDFLPRRRHAPEVTCGPLRQKDCANTISKISASRVFRLVSCAGIFALLSQMQIQSLSTLVRHSCLAMSFWSDRRNSHRESDGSIIEPCEGQHRWRCHHSRGKATSLVESLPYW